MAVVDTKSIIPAVEPTSRPPSARPGALGVGDDLQHRATRGGSAAGRHPVEPGPRRSPPTARVDARLRGDPTPEVLVGQEDDLIDPERLDDLEGAARGAADVDLGLDLCRRVHVGDHRDAGESAPAAAERPRR